MNPSAHSATNTALKACIAALKNALPAKSWSQDPDMLSPYLTEWRDKYFGQTPILLLPESTQQVAMAVKICAQHKVAIMPQGGNTGLVGANTPQGEVLINLTRMSAVRAVSSDDNILIAEAGVTLQAAQEAAHAAGRKFPLSLASEGSCTIGGNLSTNAGGVHVIKYGTSKDLVTGVEAVLPNGEIFNGLTALKKDNTGYDLSKLFLGAEGTLGIITAASLKLFPKPATTQRAMAGVASVDKALALLGQLNSPALAMFEIIPQIGLDLVTTHIPDMRHPFEGQHAWYVLIDWEFFGSEDGLSFAQDALAAAAHTELIEDAVIAQSESQAANLLALREHMSAAQKFNGGSIKHDISVPVARVPEFFTRADRAVQAAIPGSRPVGFGHLGDGNIHYNIAQPIDMEKQTFLDQWDALTKVVHDVVCDLGGSISAEHGIGIMKKDDLATRANPVKLSTMRAVKAALDPDRIMNPRVMI